MSAPVIINKVHIQWVARMHDLIYAAAFALQCHIHVRQGKGGVSLEDARRFAEEADAQADVWVEAQDERDGTR